MHLEATDGPTVLVLDVGEGRHLVLDPYELLARVPLLVKSAYVPRGDLAIQGHRQHADDPAEPRCHRGDEGELHSGHASGGREQAGEMAPGFLLVDVVCECVGADGAVQTLCGHLGHCRGAAVRIGRAGDGACAAVARDTEDGGPGFGLDVLEERGNE